MTSNSDGGVESLDLLPVALLDTIIAKLDVSSICSVASTCRTFRACASHMLSFIPTFHLLVCKFFLFIGISKPYYLFVIAIKTPTFSLCSFFSFFLCGQKMNFFCVTYNYFWIIINLGNGYRLFDFVWVQFVN